MKPIYFNHEIRHENLPPNSVIVSSSNSESNVIEIRCGIHEYSECNNWVSEFSKNTRTQWIMRSSKPNATSKLLCQKVYFCHHSAFCKADIDEHNKNKRGISKNTECIAKLIITVKLTTRWSILRDTYIKNGMPAKVRVFTRHSHPLNAPSALKQLSPADSLRDEFHNYFETGMSVTAASQFHENKLMIKSENDDSTENEINYCLDNARINPTKRTVQHWFDVWRKSPRDFNDRSNSTRVTHELFKKEIKLSNEERALSCSSSTQNESAENDLEAGGGPSSVNRMDDDDISSSKLEARSVTTISSLVNLFRKLHDKFGSSEEGIRKFTARLLKCKSRGQWETFLHTAGKNIPLRRAIGAKIKVRPTGIQRRKGKIPTQNNGKKH